MIEATLAFALSPYSFEHRAHHRHPFRIVREVAVRLSPRTVGRVGVAGVRSGVPYPFAVNFAAGTGVVCCLDARYDFGDGRQQRKVNEVGCSAGRLGSLALGVALAPGQDLHQNLKYGGVTVRRGRVGDLLITAGGFAFSGTVVIATGRDDVTITDPRVHVLHKRSLLQRRDIKTLRHRHQDVPPISRRFELRRRRGKPALLPERAIFRPDVGVFGDVKIKHDTLGWAGNHAKVAVRVSPAPSFPVRAVLGPFFAKVPNDRIRIGIDPSLFLPARFLLESVINREERRSVLFEIVKT